MTLYESSTIDYESLLTKAGVSATPHRLRVFRTIWDSTLPLSRRDLAKRLEETSPIDRVTLYRTLEVLVSSGLIERITSADRSFRYARAHTSGHEHPHFYCSGCGVMECLDSGLFNLDVEAVQRRLPVTVTRVHVRIDGLCSKCRQQDEADCSSD